MLASVLQRDAGDLSATGQIRHAQEQSGGTGHLLHLWSAATRRALYPDIDQQITARLTESEAWRYQREHSRQALQQWLRPAQLAGHDIAALIDQITAAPMDGARSISSVLNGRLSSSSLEQAVSLEPHRDNPELDVMRFSTMKALEIAEDSYRSMTRASWRPESWTATELRPVHPLT